MPRELSAVCCDRHPDPQKQRAAILKLLAAGAEIHEADKNGVTPLHHAVRFRSPGAVATLLEQGADPNRVCKRSGSTPLHRAVTSTGAPGTAGRQAEAREIVRLLLEHGANPCKKNKQGKTPGDYVVNEQIAAMFE